MKIRKVFNDASGQRLYSVSMSSFEYKLFSDITLNLPFNVSKNLKIEGVYNKTQLESLLIKSWPEILEKLYKYESFNSKKYNKKDFEENISCFHINTKDKFEGKKSITLLFEGEKKLEKDYGKNFYWEISLCPITGKVLFIQDEMM